MEFILSVAEGFRITTPVNYHSEHSEESALLRFSESVYCPTKNESLPALEYA